MTLPGFQAEFALGASKRRTIRPTATGDIANDVYPAQAWLDVLQKWRQQSGRGYMVLDCPPGQRAASVCEWWLPIYECRFTGGGNYECYITRWHCPSYRLECRLPELAVARS